MRALLHFAGCTAFGAGIGAMIGAALFADLPCLPVAWEWRELALVLVSLGGGLVAALTAPLEA